MSAIAIPTAVAAMASVGLASAERGHAPAGGSISSGEVRGDARMLSAISARANAARRRNAMGAGEVRPVLSLRTST